MLTQTAISMGPSLMVLGIWNAAFINHLYNAEKKRELLAYKAKVDPNNIMNPGKFFGIKSKFFNIPALIFNPAIFSFSMNLMILFISCYRKNRDTAHGKG